MMSFSGLHVLLSPQLEGRNGVQPSFFLNVLSEAKFLQHGIV
jgi:hypothetical protein